eukprot:306798-Pleurochrysis_carterae.AAC.1
MHAPRRARELVAKTLFEADTALACVLVCRCVRLRVCGKRRTGAHARREPGQSGKSSKRLCSVR